MDIWLTVTATLLRCSMKPGCALPSARPGLESCLPSLGALCLRILKAQEEGFLLAAPARCRQYEGIQPSAPGLTWVTAARCTR